MKKGTKAPVVKQRRKSRPDPQPKADAGSRTGPLSGGLVKRGAQAARKASERAYCPYSKFRVGAAVLTDDGKWHAGCNVENASYGLAICAERNAIFQAVANGAKSIRAVFVYTPTEKPTAPCGACRQVINEFGPRAEIISVCGSELTRRWLLSDLLADAFGPHSL